MFNKGWKDFLISKNSALPANLGTALEVADLGSDPNSARPNQFSQHGITELGSDPNSAGQANHSVTRCTTAASTCPIRIYFDIAL